MESCHHVKAAPLQSTPDRQHIVFSAGQYQPGSTAGRRLLAHELAHTLQQESQRRRLPPVNPEEPQTAAGDESGAADEEKATA